MNAADYKRWIDMDRLLSSEWGLNVPAFAHAQGVTDRQVKRDLAILRKLGQKTEVVHWRVHEIREYCQRYRKGVEPLFTRNKSWRRSS